MKAIIFTTALIFAGAIPGYCQTPHRSLASIFNSKLAFYLPSPDSTPISTSVINTAGGSPTIAPSTWLEIHGTNLAQDTLTWSTLPASAFSTSLPTSLGGVSATINNKPAAIYYISPTQINVLAPIDTATGAGVPVQVTTQFGKTTPLSVTEQSTSLGFLVIDVAGHVAAQHLDYSLLGPTSLDHTFTAAKPGETVTVYATGFGPTNPPITNQLTGTGPLPSLPSVTIGGVPAFVRYAGLASPGLYQLNIVVPLGAPTGDLTLSATYNGGRTQTGVVITVQD